MLKYYFLILDFCCRAFLHDKLIVAKLNIIIIAKLSAKPKKLYSTVLRCCTLNNHSYNSVIF